ELSALYDVAHGAGLAVIFPAWMTFVMKHNINRFAQVAVRVWGCQMNYDKPEETAKEGIKRLKQFLTSIGMPISFSELGAKEEGIPVMIEKLNLGKNGTIGNFVQLNSQDVEQIYRLAL
ncbi:MAG TPA: iron-containing alcohol dehydrogenase, partial [Mobilitalea sp.]|nr:iron-containing alcohol dehydrogenase [Mobilitalea sp.]